MSGFWAGTGRRLSRHTVITLAVVGVVTIALAAGANRLDFSTGQDSYIDPSSQVAHDNARYQSLFGGESMVVLFTLPQGKTVVDMFTPANIEQLRDAEAQMQASDTVQSVVSPLSLLQWTSDLVTSGTASNILARTLERDTDAAAQAARQQDNMITTLRLGAAGQQDLANPEWVKFLLFGNDGFTIDAGQQLVVPPDDQLVVRKALRAFIPDARHAILAGVLVGNASLDQLKAGSQTVEKIMAGRTFDNATVTITGTPTFLTDINDYLQGGMLTLGAVAVLVMIVILLLCFKVRWRLLPLLGMVFGVAWGFAAFGFTGRKLSLVTIAGLPILIGLGIEFAIQIHNRLEEERVEHPDSMFERTLVHTGPPLVTATIAAVIAFLTVRMSKVPMVQDFGVLLSIGIIALLIAGVVLPVTIIGARERRSPSTKAPMHGWVEKTVGWLGSLHRRAVMPLVAIAIVIPVLGLLLESGTKIESDPINWANQSSTSIKNARTLENETGFATTLGVFAETSSAPDNGVFTDQMGAFVFDLSTRSLGSEPELAEASSLATTVGWLAEVPGATSLPPTGLDMLEAYQLAPQSLQGLLVADNGNAAQLLFQVGPSSLEDRAVVLDDLNREIADPSVGAPLPAQSTATTGGLAVVGVGLLENITANRAQLTIVAMLLVTAFVVLRSRDLARGLLTMVPVLLAVGTSALLVRVLGITLSPLTTVSGPLIVATCAEFSVLLVARYAEERESGLDPEASTHVAAVRTGRAFFTSALTTLGGFAVLMLSTLPLLADFGMVVTINIAVALLSALVVVPPLVKEADRRGWLAMGPATSRSATSRHRATAGWIGGLAIAAVGVLVIALSTRDNESPPTQARTESAVEAPATIPPSTTTPPTTSLEPGNTLPPGPDERPSGLVAGTFWDALAAGGVNGGIARCAADNLIATKSEPDLLAMGIASSPRPDAVNQLLAQSALSCGVTQAQLDAVAAAG